MTAAKPKEIQDAALSIKLAYLNGSLPRRAATAALKALGYPTAAATLYLDIAVLDLIRY